MKLCISQITTFPKDTQTDIASYRAAGFTAAEMALSKLQNYLSEHTIEELKALMDAQGVRAVAAIGLASPDAQLLLTRGAEAEAYLKGLNEQFEICAALGVETIGVGVDPKSKEYDGWQTQAVENIRRAGDLAARQGMTIGLEFMSLAPPVGPFVVDNLRDTLALVEQVDHPAVGYNLDLFHHFRSGGTLEDIRALRDIKKLVNVHLCDIPSMPLQELDDSHRLLPGDGILPIGEIVAILKEKGYASYLSLELLNQSIWEDEAFHAVERCMDAMRSYGNF